MQFVDKVLVLNQAKSLQRTSTSLILTPPTAHLCLTEFISAFQVFRKEKACNIYSTHCTALTNHVIVLHVPVRVVIIPTNTSNI